MIFQKILVFTVLLVALVVQDTTAKAVFSKKLVRDVPPANNAALMARYITHKSEWASVGTISVTDSIKGYPFVGLESIADGPESEGTGVPYMYVTDYDNTVIDFNQDSRSTLFMSLAQGDYCKSKNYDPEDPRCARIMLTGNIVKVEKGSAEETFARNALYARHPPMSHWPTDHGWHIVKLDISQVFVFDSFGGLKNVTPEEYYAADLKNYKY